MVMDHVKDLKKTTLEGWGKPHTRAKMQQQIEFARARLRNVAHMCICDGDGDMHIVLDRFLRPDNAKPDLKTFNLAEISAPLGTGGFARIQALARQ